MCVVLPRDMSYLLKVSPGLFIGDEATARNVSFLHKMGITHVLNAAEGHWTECSFVDITADDYVGTGIVYQGTIRTNEG